MSSSIINFDRLDRNLSALAEQWRNARPFELVVIDGFADPVSCATANAARCERHLFSGQNQAIPASDGRPFGECRFIAVP